MKSRWFLALATIPALALFSSLSLPVAAATGTVKLVLGGTGATPWAIGNIAPGNSGTNTVTVTNAGSKDGVVAIWISDIVNSEGANPESETGDTAEPGELGDYLILNVSGTNLSADFTLPAKISNFPQSAADAKHIFVSPLKALSTLNLQWEWRLPPETGNDVQGDRLSLTLNYALEDFLPPAPGIVAPSAPGATMSLVDSSDPVAGGDEFTYTIRVFNQSQNDDLHNITIVGLIPGHMAFVSADGPTSFTVVGQEVRFEPVSELKPGATIEFHIQVKATAAGAAVFNATMRRDNFAEPIVNQEGTTVFVPEPPALPPPLSLAPVSPQANPASFEVRNLTVTPRQAKPGESISIVCEVTNTGGQRGEFTLRIDIPGLLQTSRMLELEAGQTQAISLTLPSGSPGTYQVDIGGAKDTFAIGTVPAVQSAPSWIQRVVSDRLLPAILAAFGAAALAYCIVIIMMKRRKYPTLRPDTANVPGQTAAQRTLYAARHQKRVAELAGAIAREMNLSKTMVRMLIMFATMRDPGSVESPYPVARTALQYHERLNGSGFPQKLAGDDILLEARILAVADTAETMSSPGPHRPAMGLDKVAEEIKRNSSTPFDSDVLKAFARLVDGGKFRFQTRYA